MPPFIYTCRGGGSAVCEWAHTPCGIVTELLPKKKYDRVNKKWFTLQRNGAGKSAFYFVRSWLMCLIPFSSPWKGRCFCSFDCGQMLRPRATIFLHIQCIYRRVRYFFLACSGGWQGLATFFFFACAEEQDISQPVHPPRHRTLNREFLRHQLQVGEGVLQRVVGWGSLQWCVRVCTCGGGHFAVIFALLGSFWGQFLSAKQ